MRIEELIKILDEHRKWLETDGASGERVNLRYRRSRRVKWNIDLWCGFCWCCGAFECCVNM